MSALRNLRAKEGGKGHWHINASLSEIFFIRPRRVVCASARSDASMAALVRAGRSTPGAHRGVGQWARAGAGAGGPAKNEIRRRGFFFFLGDQDALKYIRASVDQGKISIPRKAASQPSKHDEKVTTKVRSEIADSSQIRGVYFTGLCRPQAAVVVGGRSDRCWRRRTLSSQASMARRSTCGGSELVLHI